VPSHEQVPSSALQSSPEVKPAQLSMQYPPLTVQRPLGQAVLAKSSHLNTQELLLGIHWHSELRASQTDWLVEESEQRSRHLYIWNEQRADAVEQAVEVRALHGRTHSVPIQSQPGMAAQDAVSAASAQLSAHPPMAMLQRGPGQVEGKMYLYAAHERPHWLPPYIEQLPEAK